MGQYLLMQGLARKLLPNPPTPGKDTVLLQGEGFVDVARTRELWYQDFLGPAAVIKRGMWVDKASVGIPYIYHHDRCGPLGSRAATGRYGGIAKVDGHCARAWGRDGSEPAVQYAGCPSGHRGAARQRHGRWREDVGQRHAPAQMIEWGAIRGGDDGGQKLSRTRVRPVFQTDIAAIASCHARGTKVEPIRSARAARSGAGLRRARAAASVSAGAPRARAQGTGARALRCTTPPSRTSSSTPTASSPGRSRDTTSWRSADYAS